jgi:cell division protein FtsB
MEEIMTVTDQLLKGFGIMFLVLLALLVFIYAVTLAEMAWKKISNARKVEDVEKERDALQAKLEAIEQQLENLKSNGYRGKERGGDHGDV